MKKIKVFLLLALLAIPFLQSCNDKIDQPSQYALVTIRTTGISGFFGILDNNDKIYIGDASRVSNYVPKDGQRAIIYFNQLEAPVEGFKYNAQVYAIENILTKETILLEDKEKDTLGTDNASILRAWIGGGYLNLEFGVVTNGVTTHVLTLADNQVDVLEQKDGYITLDFRHNAKGLKEGQPARGTVCFNLGMYNPTMRPDCKGLYIRYKPLNNGDEMKYITVELNKEATGE